MPNSSYPDLVRDLQLLLRAFEDNADQLGPAQAQRDSLDATLSQLLNTKARQDSFTAQRQQTTQELEALIHRARDEARSLRGMVRGLIGLRNERLVQFQVSPLRRRTRVPEAPPPPPPVEAPAPVAEMPEMAEITEMTEM